MKINGKIISTRRKELGLTQQELAEGICNQATISVLETKNACDSMKILGEICQRLKLTFDDVLEKSFDEKLRGLLARVIDLSSEFKFQEAYQLLEGISDVEAIENSDLKAEVYYNFGNINLVGFHEIDKALYYFYEVSTMNVTQVMIKSLAINSIGVCYAQKGELEFARGHFDKSLQLIKENSDFVTKNVSKIFYNVAKFYSSLGDFSRAVALCDQGLELYKQFKSTSYLDFLYYEKAFNLQHLDEEKAKKYFALSAGIAEFNDNQFIIDTINSGQVNHLEG